MLGFPSRLFFNVALVFFLDGLMRAASVVAVVVVALVVFLGGLMEGEGSVESDSSDSPLSKAIAASGVAPEQAAAAPIVEPGQAAAAPIGRSRKNWRIKERQVSLRKRDVREAS